MQTSSQGKVAFKLWPRVLRDLPTFGHIPNKSRSLGDIGKVACSVTPSATCPLRCFVAISLKNSRAKLTCIVLLFPVTTPPKVGSCVVFYTIILLLTLITCEMLSNLENRDWNEIFKGGQNELWQWGHWVIPVLLTWKPVSVDEDYRIPYAFLCMRFSTFIPVDHRWHQPVVIGHRTPTFATTWRMLRTRCLQLWRFPVYIRNPHTPWPARFVGFISCDCSCVVFKGSQWKLS